MTHTSSSQFNPSYTENTHKHFVAKTVYKPECRNAGMLSSMTLSKNRKAPETSKASFPGL